ncbi:hypothetical protein VPHG_00137 [Vibrio phage 11895-B1]|uniref:hypothetical protein n=1 Tax=Vibrio phage 11895-B1 TaxID=754075 RepID=UPI0002C06A7A|nr:hypothetical protein VPHG_00137 [Vibrio phage 11895-B1]AGH32203.1 hypothetical protein VPHG_00137 [Vibrio phage 11895-B1]
MDKMNLLKKFTEFFDKLYEDDELSEVKDALSEQEEEFVKSNDQQTLIKAFDDDQHISVEILIEPEVVDAHGMWCSKETIQKGYEDFDKMWKEDKIPMNLYHMIDVEKDQLELVKHYILPCDCMVGETAVKEGTWVCEVKWHNEELYKMRTVPNEEGILEIAGLSYKGWGTVLSPSDENIE